MVLSKCLCLVNRPYQVALYGLVDWPYQLNLSNGLPVDIKSTRDTDLTIQEAAEDFIPRCIPRLFRIVLGSRLLCHRLTVLPVRSFLSGILNHTCIKGRWSTCKRRSTND